MQATMTALKPRHVLSSLFFVDAVSMLGTYVEFVCSG